MGCIPSSCKRLQTDLFAPVTLGSLYCQRGDAGVCSHGMSHLISFRHLHEDEANCVPEMPAVPHFPQAANSGVNVCLKCLLPICSQTRMLSKEIGISSFSLSPLPFFQWLLIYCCFENLWVTRWNPPSDTYGTNSLPSFPPWRGIKIIQVTGCRLVAWHSLKKCVIESWCNSYVSAGKKMLLTLKNFVSLTHWIRIYILLQVRAL